MLKRTSTSLALVALLTFTACNNQSDAKQADELKQIELLQTEVMDLHDEGMKHTMAIRRLTTRTQELADSLTNLQQDATAFVSAHQLLDSATQEMNTWMHAYDMSLENKSNTEKLQYLQSEKAKMTSIKELMEQSVQKAKTLLNEQ
jgi:uncharacterized lipoprotein NlpE involved in copper resistance